MKRTILLLCLLLTSLDARSFSAAKKILLKKVYYDHQVTFYCQNPYELRQVDGKQKARIIQDSTKYTPRNEFNKKGKVNIRAKRIEWEHVVPAENIGRQFSCWRDGDSRCVSKKGKSYKGRRCCYKVSPKFKEMAVDMMNLVPGIGEVNADRSNFRFMDTNMALKGQYGECSIKIDFKGRKVYPANYTKGFIGRIYLYFSKRYGMKLSKRDRKMYNVWNKKYPPTEWEKVRKERINFLQN